MRIGVFSDTHLGNTTYKNQNVSDNAKDYGRKEDYRESFEEAINLFLEIKPDFVFHLGDILEAKADGEIYNESIKVAVDGIRKLLRAGIKVILVEGNHDFVKSHDEENRVFSIIERVFEDHLDRDLFVARAGKIKVVDVFGIPAVAIGYTDEADPSIVKAKVFQAEKEINGQKAMILLHQSVGEDIPYRSLNYDDVPKNFRIIFNGHIHKPLIKYLSDNRLFLNVGSTEYENVAEAVDYREVLNYEGESLLRFILKGIYVLEGRGIYKPKVEITDGNIPKHHLEDRNFIPLRKCRPFIKFDCSDWATFEEVLKKIADHNIKPPYVRVELGGGIRVEDAERRLNNLMEKGYIHRYILKWKQVEVYEGGKVRRGGEIPSFEELEEVRPYAHIIRTLRGKDVEEMREEISRIIFSSGR
jgi:DNA repair exonuclease SbcCD nuclease subunit